MSKTIKDISRLAGVSYSTVSRALNDTGKMSDETRRKILKIAAELNYIPNYSARSLVTDKSYNIGVFTIAVSSINNAFYEIVDGIQRVTGHKYNLFFKRFKNESELIEILKLKKYDGIIFVNRNIDDQKYIDIMAEMDVPLIVINRRMIDDKFYHVIAEDMEGAFKATEHLIKQGHKEIAFIEGSAISTSARERKKGFLNALVEYDLPINNDLIKGDQNNPESGYNAVMELLNQKIKFSAAFAYCDPVAIGVMKAISENGLRIPDDIAVVGFDNMLICQYLVPSLTSIEKPRVEMGIKAAELLMKILNRERIDSRSVVIGTTLVVRESCGANK